MEQRLFKVIRNKQFVSGCCLLTLIPADGGSLPECRPGQFVQIKTECAGVLLRRPISICNVNGNELDLFIKPVGKGSAYLTGLSVGDTFDMIIPLGHGFSCEGDFTGRKVLLAGGGVGAAPLVFLTEELAQKGAQCYIALGGRTDSDVNGLCEMYKKACFVAVSTDDGTAGEPGVITENSVFKEDFDFIYCCGPTPMMKAVSKIARERNICCEVSLENTMACGLGACLCCVQETSDRGNVCVCTEGPVFNINRLKEWN